MNMPGMTGIELAIQLNPERPATKIPLIAGFPAGMQALNSDWHFKRSSLTCFRHNSRSSERSTVDERSPAGYVTRTRFPDCLGCSIFLACHSDVPGFPHLLPKVALQPPDATDGRRGPNERTISPHKAVQAGTAREYRHASHRHVENQVTVGA